MLSLVTLTVRHLTEKRSLVFLAGISHLMFVSWSSVC